MSSFRPDPRGFGTPSSVQLERGFAARIRPPLAARGAAEWLRRTGTAALEAREKGPHWNERPQEDVERLGCAAGAFSAGALRAGVARAVALYSKRRVRQKQSFWSLRTLHARFRTLPAAHMAMWVSRAEKEKEDRRAALRDRRAAAESNPSKLDTPAAPPACPEAAHGATTKWLRLDCSAEPPSDASEVAEEEAPANAEVGRIQWVDDLGCDRRSLRRLPESQGELGQGSYGCCYIFEDEVTGEHVCAKLQKAAGDSEGERALRNEIRIMNTCNHPNVMRAFAVVHCLGIGRYALLMPKCDCDLRAWLEVSRAPAAAEEDDGPARRQRSRILVQLCRGYSHLHGAGYLHLDVKPENVVVQAATGTEGVRLCIADFGISLSWHSCGSADIAYAPASSIQ